MTKPCSQCGRQSASNTQCNYCGNSLEEKNDKCSSCGSWLHTIDEKRSGICDQCKKKNGK